MLHPSDNIQDSKEETQGEPLMINPEDITFEDLNLDLVTDIEEGDNSGEEDNTKATSDQEDGNKEKEDPTESKKEDESKDEPSEEDKKEESSKSKKEEEKTKESTDDEGDEDGPVDEISGIEEYAESMGLELAEDHGYEDSIEGLVEITNDVINVRVQEELQAFFAQNEEVARYHLYIQQGNNPRDYFKDRHGSVDFSSYNVTEEDTATQKMLVKNFYKAQGLDDETINSTIDAFELGNTLLQQAKVAQTALVNAQKKQAEEFAKKQDDLAIKQKKQADALFNSVSETISKQTEFAGVAIPKNQLTGLAEYMLNKVEGGRTQRDLDSAKLTLDKQVLLSWLIKSDFNLQAVVNALASKKQSKGLRSRLKKEAAKTRTGKDRTQQRSNNSSGKIEVKELNLDLATIE